MDEISNSDKVTEHTIKKVKYHIKYNKDTMDSDVALIELNEPIEFRENARPVCLPAETDSFIGHNATVVGWGKVREYGPSSRFLRRVDVEIIKTDDCKKAYEPIKVTNNMICAWHPKGGKDACQGDSGGPLMVKVRTIYAQKCSKNGGKLQKNLEITFDESGLKVNQNQSNHRHNSLIISNSIIMNIFLLRKLYLTNNSHTDFKFILCIFAKLYNKLHLLF